MSSPIALPKSRHGSDQTCVVCGQPAVYHEIDASGHVYFCCEDHTSGGNTEPPEGSAVTR
jgi:hypothetical protein